MLSVRLRSSWLTVSIGLALAQSATAALPDSMTTAIVLLPLVAAAISVGLARRRARTSSAQRASSAYRMSAAEPTERTRETASTFSLTSASGLWAGLALLVFRCCDWGDFSALVMRALRVHVVIWPVLLVASTARDLRTSYAAPVLVAIRWLGGAAITASAVALTLSWFDAPYSVLSPSTAFAMCLVADGIACSALVARLAAARMGRDYDRALHELARAVAPFVVLTAAVLLTLSTCRGERDSAVIALLAIGCVVSVASTYFVIRRIEAVLRPDPRSTGRCSRMTPQSS